MAHFIAGSDNEIPLTPIRQTRRTRRDSTSSIEKQGIYNFPKKKYFLILFLC